MNKIMKLGLFGIACAGAGYIAGKIQKELSESKCEEECREEKTVNDEIREPEMIRPKKINPEEIMTDPDDIPYEYDKYEPEIEYFEDEEYEYIDIDEGLEELIKDLEKAEKEGYIVYLREL